MHFILLKLERKENMEKQNRILYCVEDRGECDMSLGTWHFSEKGYILKKLNKAILVKCNYYAAKR